MAVIASKAPSRIALFATSSPLSNPRRMATQDHAKRTIANGAGGFGDFTVVSMDFKNASNFFLFGSCTWSKTFRTSSNGDINAVTEANNVE
jgi:hypothetical protein